MDDETYYPVGDPRHRAQAHILGEWPTDIEPIHMASVDGEMAAEIALSSLRSQGIRAFAVITSSGPTFLHVGEQRTPGGLSIAILVHPDDVSSAQQVMEAANHSLGEGSDDYEEDPDGNGPEESDPFEGESYEERSVEDLDLTDVDLTDDEVAVLAAGPPLAAPSIGRRMILTLVCLALLGASIILFVRALS